MQPGFLSIRSLTKRYDTIVAVDNLNLEIPKGELVAFLGPSGLRQINLAAHDCGLALPQRRARS